MEFEDIEIFADDSAAAEEAEAEFEVAEAEAFDAEVEFGQGGAIEDEEPSVDAILAAGNALVEAMAAGLAQQAEQALAGWRAVGGKA